MWYDFREFGCHLGNVGLTDTERQAAGFRVVAILAIRNERPYLANCLDYLIADGLDYFIIDNESDDGTAELLREPRFAAHLVGYQSHAFRGAFDLEGLMAAIDAAIPEIDADWVLHQSPDEMMHSYNPGERLVDAIARIDTAGYDVIDFNEFVFLPIDHDYLVDHKGAQPLRWYYFHKQGPGRLMRARRQLLQLSWMQSGGHRLQGQPFRLAPENFVLRHYMFQSQEHAFTKYPDRRYRQEEVDRGWHGNRIGVAADRFTFPETAELEYLGDRASHELSRDRPRKLHYWQW